MRISCFLAQEARAQTLFRVRLGNDKPTYPPPVRSSARTQQGRARRRRIIARGETGPYIKQLMFRYTFHFTSLYNIRVDAAVTTKYSRPSRSHFRTLLIPARPSPVMKQIAESAGQPSSTFILAGEIRNPCSSYSIFSNC